MIRAIEKLAYEAQNNGNINWDSDFELLADYIENTLIESGVFDPQAKLEIQRDIDRIKDYEYPVTEDDIYDCITERIVDWYLENKEPVKRDVNPDLTR